MFESGYWKDELNRSLVKLRRWQTQKRWSVRSVYLFEKEVILSFFITRKLIETGKLSDECRARRIQATAFRNSGIRVDRMNRHRIDQHFELQKGIKARLTLAFTSNQIIHCFIIVTEFNESGLPTGVLISSDFERNTALYFVSLAEIIDTIGRVARDHVRYLIERRNPKTDDMEIVYASVRAPKKGRFRNLR